MHLKTITLGASLALAPGLAVAQYDPGASRAENQVNSANRSMMQQQQTRAIQQQNQFENNALRNELSRPAPGPIVPNVGTIPRR